MIDIKQLQEKLETYDNEISIAEKKQANIEGRQESILEKLKTEFKIDNIKEIDLYISDNEKEIQKLENEINNNVTELEKYDIEQINE
jgi:hypothetical protein